MNMPDSVSRLFGTAAAGADKKTLAQVALKTGSDAYKAGNASKNRTDLQRAVQFLMLADQLDASADAKFLAGASAFLIGQSAVNEAQDTKSCRSRASRRNRSDGAGERSCGICSLYRCGEAAAHRDSAVHSSGGRPDPPLLQVIRGAPGAWDSAYHAPVLADEIIELFRVRRTFSIALWGAADTPPPFLHRRHTSPR